MELNVYKVDGSKTESTISLSENIFDVKPSDAAIYHDIMCYRTKNRQGTNMAKTRSLVSGGGRKPYRQKGTGRARAGTSRSGVWVGGGRIFPPEPIDYKYKISKKEKSLARKSAYTYKAREDCIKILEDFNLPEVKTKSINNIVTALEVKGSKVLIITSDYDKNVWLSSRNIPWVEIKPVKDVSTYDIIDADKLVFQKSALEKLNQG